MSMFGVFSLILFYTVQSAKESQCLPANGVSAQGNSASLSRTAKIVTTINDILTTPAKRNAITQFVNKAMKQTSHPTVGPELTKITRNINTMYGNSKNSEFIKQWNKRQADLLENQQNLDVYIKYHTKWTEILKRRDIQDLAKKASNIEHFLTKNEEWQKLAMSTIPTLTKMLATQKTNATTPLVTRIFIAEKSLKNFAIETANMLLDENNISFMKKMAQKSGPLMKSLVGPDKNTAPKNKKTDKSGEKQSKGTFGHWGHSKKKNESS